MADEHKGFTAAGFTPQQAEFLHAVFGTVKNLAEAHALWAWEEAAILRTILEAKGIIVDEEIEAERTRRAERYTTLVDLESMVDPEFKRGVEFLDERLRRRPASRPKRRRPRAVATAAHEHLNMNPPRRCAATGAAENGAIDGS